MLPISMLWIISGVKNMFRKIISIIFALSAVILFSGISTYSEASKPFMWRGVEVKEFPYVVKSYPKGMSVTADGKDLLAGETVSGVSYKGGTLTLDNVSIDGEIKVTGVSTLKVSITGDNDLNRLVFDGTHMSVVGNGTLTAKKIESVNSHYSSFIVISENVRIYGKTDYENDTKLNTPMRFSGVYVEGNSYLECAEIRGGDLTLRGNARVKTSHCHYIDTLSLSGNSVLEVETDYEKYSKLDMGYDLNDCLNMVLYTYIRDDARLSVVCDTPVCGIYSSGSRHFGEIKISDNGILDISGNSRYGISLDNTAFGTLTMNGNSKVNISGFDIGIAAQRIDINGGTLDIHANKCAVQIDDIISPYANFEPILSINGDIASQSCDWEVTDFTEDEMEQYDWYYDILRSAETGEPLKDFSITVVPKEN